ncbi:MAG: hypothetical protein KAW12_02845 [Candidatus Aminicenantes bacterium]|nr:hypothetical protein [Candidatus Aminicenantes bacterium]
MQTSVENIWSKTRKLSRLEKMELVEKLVHQLRIEETSLPGPLNWEQMYGIGKGLWNIDAQAYVDKIREDRC